MCCALIQKLACLLLQGHFHATCFWRSSCFCSTLISPMHSLPAWAISATEVGARSPPCAICWWAQLLESLSRTGNMTTVLAKTSQEGHLATAGPPASSPWWMLPLHKNRMGGGRQLRKHVEASSHNKDSLAASENCQVSPSLESNERTDGKHCRDDINYHSRKAFRAKNTAI